MTELAEVFCRYGPPYRAQYGDRMLPSHRQAMRDIEHCRTPALGGHVYECPDCGETHYLYHSCRNRHCPKCQNDKAQQWLVQQQDLLLPAPHFLVTFTLPSELREMTRSHQKRVYHLLFRTSADAMQRLASDERFVGGQLGMIGVLHTWGRNLSYHPHVHYLVPGGGLAPDGSWHPSRANFLLPVKALSRIFRAKFRDGLRYSDPDCFADIPSKVWNEEWVVHSKPVGNGLGAVKYLAPYVFRVAISNNRILKLEHDKVTFRYRASDTGKLKVCVLPAGEFIRRFLQHVLPKGFVKVRYYGFFSPGLRKRLAALRDQLDDLSVDWPSVPEVPDTDTQTTDDLADVTASSAVVRCPSCDQVMRRGAIIPPQKHSPP
jgi:hypothetical protein